MTGASSLEGQCPEEGRRQNPWDYHRADKGEPWGLC